MLKAIKFSLLLLAITGLLSACASKDTKDTSTAQTPPPAVEPSPTPEPSEPVWMDPAANAETVFYFEFDQATLNGAARAALTLHAQSLQESPVSVRLQGHADERGSREYNLALGERRANAVRDFLVLQGVDASLLETISYGEERPVATGSSEVSGPKTAVLNW